MFKEINDRKLKKRKKGVMLVFSFQNLFMSKTTERGDTETRTVR